MLEPEHKIGKTMHRNSLTTVGMYLRNVRAVYRRPKGIMFKSVTYPFGEGKYEIPTAVILKGIDSKEIGLIANYK